MTLPHTLPDQGPESPPRPRAARTIRAFLSYPRGRVDVARFLEGMALHYQEHVSLWYDSRLEALNEPFPDAIVERLDHARVLLAVIDGSASDSRWCRREREIFLEKVAADRTRVIIPLRLDDSPPERDVLAEITAVDFRRWMVEGDRLFREKLLPRWIGGPVQDSQTPLLSGSDPQLLVSLRALLLHHARGRSPAAVTASLEYITVRALQAGASDPCLRSRVLDGLAGLYFNQGRWAACLGATRAALDELEAAGIRIDSAEAPDAWCGFLGHCWNRMAVLSRQEGALAEVEGWLEQAHGAFLRLHDPLHRADAIAQVLREKGTLAQVRGQLDQAARFFADSAASLHGLPSQRFHVHQARIKIAQVHLMRCEIAPARLILDEVMPALGPDQINGELGFQVRCHGLLTETWCRLCEGRLSEVRVTLAELREDALARGLQNEARRARLLERGLMVAAVTPRAMVPRILALGATRLWSSGKG